MTDENQSGATLTVEAAANSTALAAPIPAPMAATDFNEIEPPNHKYFLTKNEIDYLRRNVVV